MAIWKNMTDRQQIGVVALLTLLIVVLAVQPLISYLKAGPYWVRSMEEIRPAVCVVIEGSVPGTVPQEEGVQWLREHPKQAHTYETLCGAPVPQG